MDTNQHNKPVVMQETVCVNLGCGKNVIPGWDNLDMYPLSQEVIKCNLNGPLPYLDASVGFIYSEHLIEHFDEVDGFNLLKQIFRILKPGGVLRISTPDLGAYIDYYNNFSNQSPERFSTPCQFLNYAMLGEADLQLKFLNIKTLNCDHRYIYDYQDIKNKLIEIGFGSVEKTIHGHSKHKILRDLETRRTMDLIVEATKRPKSP